MLVYCWYIISSVDAERKVHWICPSLQSSAKWLQIPYIAAWGFHDVFLRSWENKWEEYLVCHTLPSDSCKPWSSPMVWITSLRGLRLPQINNFPPPCTTLSLSHSSWAAKNRKQSCKYKAKKRMLFNLILHTGCGKSDNYFLLGCAHVFFIRFQHAPAR